MLRPLSQFSGNSSHTSHLQDVFVTHDLIGLKQWFPTGGSWRSGCVVVNSSHNSFLKVQIFKTAHVNIVCYISKSETRIHICEVNIIFVIISIWFLYYAVFNQP